MALESRGVECRLARNREGRVGLEDLAARVDERTRVLAVSWVAFHNGWVYPIEEIGRFCRERGILFVVDAIQGLGQLPIDVASSAVDILCADGHKWLFGAEGCAIFYVAESAREKVPPSAIGWWNVRHRERFLDYRLDLRSGGRRYEPGTLPTGNVFGLSAALDLLQEIGIDAIRARNLGTATALRDGLAARGWRIMTPAPIASAILMAEPPSGDARSTVNALEEREIVAAPREGAVRFSPHASNDLGEIERVLAAIDAMA
jgi:selenocysteine lyase/cysteine desulfurase